MAKVGQISIARPGFPLQLKFDESELKTTLEGEAQSGDHVTLYPGDFSTWFENANLSQDTPIEIREGVSVTILPGAKVSYTDEFRKVNFAHDGDAFDSFDGDGNPNHPLNTESDNPSKRYKVPNFTGHVENIVDLNFGSEWAFKSDVQKLRNEFNNLTNDSVSLTISVDSQTENSMLELGEKLEFVEGDNVNISTQENQEGVSVDVSFDKNSVSSIDAGKNLIASKSTGEVRLDHETVIPSGSSENDGSAVIQSLFFKNGHVSAVETRDVATLNEREPRNNEGEEGDIWMVGERDFILNFFLSSNDPDLFSGQEGDLWVVEESLNSEFQKVSNFFISKNPPSNKGDDGSFWFSLENFSEPDSIQIKDVEEIIFQNLTPVSSEGKDGEIRATSTREV